MRNTLLNVDHAHLQFTEFTHGEPNMLKNVMTLSKHNLQANVLSEAHERNIVKMKKNDHSAHSHYLPSAWPGPS